MRETDVGGGGKRSRGVGDRGIEKGGWEGLWGRRIGDGAKGLGGARPGCWEKSKREIWDRVLQKVRMGNLEGGEKGEGGKGREIEAHMNAREF